MFTYDFEELNLYNGTRSPSGRVQNDFTTRYYMRALYQRAIAGAKFVLPETWSMNYFKNVLYGMGFIAIVPTSEYGVIPQICGISGYGVFRQPVRVLVKQPLVQYEGDIGRDCELIRLTPDYMGIIDIVEHYATMLSTAATSLNVALVNSRVPFMGAAKNKAASETLKMLVEKISAGEIAVIYDKTLKDSALEKDDPIWLFQQHVKENYIVTDILKDMNTILQAFDREVGIAAIGEKAERRIEAEVELMSADSCARCETWANALQETFDNTNRMFPELHLSFELKYGGKTYEYNA